MLQREVTIDIFNYHHRSVYDHANRYGQPSQRHEIGRQADLTHYDERGQWSQDQSADDNERTPDIAQEEEEYDDDQYHPFRKSLIHCAQSRINQLDPIVEWYNPQSIREQLPGMDVFYSSFDALNHVAGVAPSQHENDAAHDLPLPVQHSGTMPNGVINPYLGHIAYEDWGACNCLYDNAFDILKAANEPLAPHDVFLGVLFQNIPAGVGIVVGDAGSTRT
jgi:hypothetical protein